MRFTMEVEKGNPDGGETDESTWEATVYLMTPAESVDESVVGEVPSQVLGSAWGSTPAEAVMLAVADVSSYSDRPSKVWDGRQPA